MIRRRYDASVIGMATVAFLLAACSRTATNEWIELHPGNPGSGPSIRISGTVRHLELEGGLFVIRDAQGTQYNPLNLPAAFRTDGTPVEVEARLRNDVATIGMAGEVVELLRIRRRSAAPEEDSQDFTALGQEPGWHLEIVSGKQITFTYDYGESKFVSPAPAPRTETTGGVRIYDTNTASGSLRVEIDPTPCADVMSGQPFPATVTVTLNGRSFRGCGGPAK